MTVLYLTEAGLELRLHQNQLQVVRDGNPEERFPLEKIRSLVLFRGCHLTSPVTMALLDRRIPVIWIGADGRFLGRLEPPTGYRIMRQQRQFQLFEDQPFCLYLARQSVKAKIINSQVVLSRYQRDIQSSHLASAIAELQRSRQEISMMRNVDMLLGCEGNAAAAYFSAIADIVPAPFAFAGRHHRPPRDPVNAMMSFAYTLLLNAFYTAILSKGLQPYLGFYHRPRDGHPALCSDLMEAWRPAFADRLVLSLLRRKEVTRDSFTIGNNGGVYLNKEGRKPFIKRFEARLDQSVSYEEGKEMPFRQLIVYQVNTLVKAIESYDPTLYKSLEIR